MTVAVQRAAEVEQGVEAWGVDRCVLLSLTERHDGQGLAHSVKVLSDAWRKTRSGEPWRRIEARYGIEGSIRGLEVTHGGHGWHPHLHVVLFLNEQLSRQRQKDLEREIGQRWQLKVQTFGGWSMRPTMHAGVDVRSLRRTNYVAKLGLEIASAVTKRGRRGSRSPWEIGADLAEHDREQDAALWREYQTAMRGRRALVWSPGLRDRLQLGSEAADDELATEAADETVEDDRVIAFIEKALWFSIRDVPGLPARILDVAEQGGGDAVRALLARFSQPPACVAA